MPVKSSLETTGGAGSNKVWQEVLMRSLKKELLWWSKSLGIPKLLGAFTHTVYDFQPYLEMIASDFHYFQTEEGWSLTDKLYSGYCNILRPPLGKHPFTMPGQHAVLQKCNMQTSNIPKKLEELCKWFDMAMSLAWLQFLTGEQLFATVCVLAESVLVHCGNITLKDRMYLANVTWWFNIIWLVVWNIFYFPQ